MCFYELFCYLNIFFPFCKSETSKKFWFLPWRIVTMPKSFLGWWFLFFFSLRIIHNTKQQLVTLQPQRPILMFSSAITVWGLVGIWGCRFRSKCSVGTAGRKKISKCWLQESNNYLQNIQSFWPDFLCHRVLRVAISGVSCFVLFCKHCHQLWQL